MIIVTGGAGFIGSHLIEKINNVGINDIIVVDWLSDQGKWQNLLGRTFDSILEPYEFLQQLEAGQLSEISAIFHLGACSDTTETNADYLLKNNTHYSIQVAKYAFKNDIPLVYASSAATYGDGSKGYDDTVISNLKPLNAYGWSKQLFDEWVVKYGQENSWFGFKFFNVYGPNETFKNNMASKVWHGFHEASKTKEIKLFKSDRKEIKDGEQKRDFIFVDDITDTLWQAYQKLAQGDTTQSAVLNLGTGKARTFTELAHAVFSALEVDASIRWVDMPNKLKGKYQYYTQANMQNFIDPPYNLLGREFTSLEAGVKKTIDRLKTYA